MNWCVILKGLEKQAGPIGGAMMAGLNMISMKQTIDDNMKNMKVDPLEDAQSELPDSSNLQLEGSKKIQNTSTSLPHSTRYM